MKLTRHILHSTTIAIILMGLLVGYAKSDYSYDPLNLWNRCYYVWDKGVQALLILCVIFPVKKFNIAWTAVGVFFAIRLVWEWGAIQDYRTASRPSIIFSLFLIDISVVVFIMFYPELKKSYNTWIIPLLIRLKKKEKWPKEN